MKNLEQRYTLYYILIKKRPDQIHKLDFLDSLDLIHRLEESYTMNMSKLMFLLN